MIHRELRPRIRDDVRDRDHASTGECEANINTVRGHIKKPKLARYVPFLVLIGQD